MNKPPADAIFSAIAEANVRVKNATSGMMAVAALAGLFLIMLR